MHYREFDPPRRVGELVECFWIYRADDRDLQRIAPDGRCEIVVHLAGRFHEVGPSGSIMQPEALFAGQLTSPLHLQATGTVWSVCARLRPAAAGSYLRQAAASATDRRIPLADLDPLGAERLPSILRLATSDEARVAALADHVEGRFRASPIALDARVEDAVRRLEDLSFPSPGAVASALPLNLRTLQRLFKRHVGVSPQAYASVVRFRRIFDELSATASTLSDAAYAAGYSDHPQMAREFQRFLGCSATRFASERKLLAAALTGPRHRT
ncbi:MAG TPA: helix-turn-helix transcriptional regulator [Allosphingosinicella sp.]|jgi:AraC-like DNA-binding protein